MPLRHALPAALIAGLLAACGQSGGPDNSNGAGPNGSDPAPDTAAADPAAASGDPVGSPAADATADPAAMPDAPAGGECAATVTGTDQMQYDTKAIDVPASCTDFTITLKHSGTMPVAAMGHNLVISKTSDMQGVTSDGLSAPIEASHVKAGDPRVIAFTTMIGGGETTSVTVPVAKLKEGGPFSFFCTFPGHLSMMQGTIAVK